MPLVGDNAERAADVAKNRESVYGSPETMQQCLADHWTALLRAYHQNDALPAIPPRLVGLMLAMLKVHRAAVNTKKKDRDSYVDVHNYIDFAERIDDTLPSSSNELDITAAVNRLMDRTNEWSLTTAEHDTIQSLLIKAVTAGYSSSFDSSQAAVVDDLVSKARELVNNVCGVFLDDLLNDAYTDGRMLAAK